VVQGDYASSSSPLLPEFCDALKHEGALGMLALRERKEFYRCTNLQMHSTNRLRLAYRLWEGRGGPLGSPDDY
jgi:hypothetical protein